MQDATRERATERINIRCTARQREAIATAAAADGSTISDYLLRRALTDYPDTHAEELATAARAALDKLKQYLDSHKRDSGQQAQAAQGH